MCGKWGGNGDNVTEMGLRREVGMGMTSVPCSSLITVLTILIYLLRGLAPPDSYMGWILYPTSGHIVHIFRPVFQVLDKRVITKQCRQRIKLSPWTVYLCGRLNQNAWVQKSNHWHKLKTGTARVHHLVAEHGLMLHQYADDCQTYIATPAVTRHPQ